MKINRDYVSKQNTYAGSNSPEYIVVHETDNFSPGAGACRHAQAQAAGHLSTSVHYYAGSDGVFQAAEHSDGTYSVGKEYGGSHAVRDAHNRNTINIEICVNQDGDYAVARANAIDLVKYLIKTTGIPAGRVIRHYDAKGKYCPRKMMDDPALWDDFKAKIGQQEAAGAGQAEAVPTPKVQEAMPGTVVTQTDPLNIRDMPDGRKIGQIPKGALVEVLEQGAEWHRVRYGEYVGYCSAKYIQIHGKAEGGYVGKCTGDGVRVRATPEFGDNILRKLNKGNLFDVLDVSGVWTHIRVEGKEGYIYSEYVARA